MATLPEIHNFASNHKSILISNSTSLHRTIPCPATKLLLFQLGQSHFSELGPPVGA